MFKRVIFTSGPTIEPIDPIRFLSNRSSGKTGFHLANEAVKRNIPEIIFITGPTHYKPAGVTFIPVETALQMREQLLKFVGGADVVIMAAAVCDYRIARYRTGKIKKSDDKLVLEFTRNPDLLWETGQNKRANQLLVGFAAETDNILENALEKFQKKNLDLLVLNEVSAENPAFNAEDNQVYLVAAGGARKLEKMEKSILAAHIWDEIYKIKKKNELK